MTDLKRIIERLQEGIEVRVAEAKIDIVVMGPRLGGTSPAAKLRRDIIKAASAYGASIKPEHEGLAQASKEGFGAGHHLTILEMLLVDVSDLVVLIPDSPGSLCELGLFSSYPSATSKLLILVNADYPEKGSYVTDGPLTAARHNQAEVYHVDYSDFDKAWGYVENRLQRVRAQQSMRDLTDPGG